MLLSYLTGKKVLDSRGDLIGKVTDIEINLMSGTIKTLLVRSGLSRPVPVKLEDVIVAGDRIIIGKLKSDIKKVETFSFLGIKRRLLFNW
ncbi:MAG: PRC-barrel domain-containing protein [Dehalococcoidia bacterium]|jgi:sporulation protein YlmC with PRC-barrel domain